MKCSKCGHEIVELETLEVEGFTITKPIICKTYEEAKQCPKGFRLPTRWELFKIFEKMENRKKLTDKTFMFFWGSLIESDCVKGLYLSRVLDVYSDVDNLAGSSDDGRVVWIKVKK